MQPLGFDFIYFAFISMMFACIWWWCCSDQSHPCRRRRHVADAAEVASQREILTLQLQEDLRELRLQRQQNGGSLQDNSSLDPATAEELAKIQLERRKEIKAQLKCREYQTKATNGTTAASTTSATSATIPVGLSEDDDCEGSCNICLNEFQQGEQVSDAMNPECRHFYHTECVIDWLLRNKICPICRRDFLQAEADAC